jgi:signal transduction histidine kinase
VASQWRIRHKLMLGLGLVVAIMALLLSGTSRGLWSYYITTNAIRAKLTEKEAADEFRAAVTKLVSRHAVATYLGNLGYDKLHEATREALALLDVYEEKLQETLSQGRDPEGGDWERGMIEHLRNDLTRFRQAIEKELEPDVSGPSSIQREEVVWKKLGGADGPGATAERAGGRPVADLTRDTRDLCQRINRELAERLSESRRHYQMALWIIVPSSVVGLLLMAGLMGSFYAWVFNPIRDLAAGVGRVAGGDLAHRIELRSGDEMEDLANAFNDMMRRLQELYSDLARQVNERSRQLVRSERLASVGFLAAGVAHEINNPLASIAFCAEALEARLTDLLRHLRPGGRAAEEHEVFARYLKMIQEEAFRCKNITERLLAVSRSGERKREPVDLHELVESVLEVTQHLQNHKGKHIVFEAGGERGAAGRVTAWVNGEEIKSVVLNLVINALDSMDDGGRLALRLAQRDGMAELRVADTGCGMTQEVLENVFEPFFTRSRTGKGTGLGLTISHRIVTQHGGEIEASSPGPGLGSTFTVRLPLRPHEAPEAPAPRPLAA